MQRSRVRKGEWFVSGCVGYESKRQADVSSACLPLSYEVLLIDKNEFILLWANVAIKLYASTKF